MRHTAELTLEAEREGQCWPAKPEMLPANPTEDVPKMKCFCEAGRVWMALTTEALVARKERFLEMSSRANEGPVILGFLNLSRPACRCTGPAYDRSSCD